MHASIPDYITGRIQILISLADDVGVATSALADLVAKWIRAVEVGFFGPGRIGLLGEVDTLGHRVSAWLECAQVSEIAFHALSRMIQRFSEVKGRVESTCFLREDSSYLMKERDLTIPALPQSIPFTVEYSDDLHADVRVEIEFRMPLAQAEREALFSMLSIWDMLVEALGDPQRWGEEIEYDTRLLSPAIVEHEVFGYFGGFECLNFIVLLGLRLHKQVTIERITFE